MLSSRSFRKLNRIALLLATLSLLCGCQSVGYYSQSIVGHSKLMLARMPIERAIKTVDPQTAEKLRLSKELKKFSVQELGLPDNTSYTTYVALERDYPVWVVTAAPPYSLKPKQWCYFIIGCASYRGYFSREAATAYANGLERKGWEVNVGGAPAYSTLGWFSDPILPSMLRTSDVDFAEMLFHELAHQRLYINGESSLNEAFASLVGEQGAIKWLTAYFPDKLERYLRRQQALRDFSGLIEQLKSELNRIYDQSYEDDIKGREKKKAIVTFRKNYESFKLNEWSGKGYFDNWVLQPINNARLAAFSTYHTKLPPLEALLRRCGGDLRRLYQRLENNHLLEAPYVCR
ncbi:aminopeptidase [Arenicella sp. 4NH20-0111]|uniref:aminopeptidase n=1 Tax=Arenicella sp. 4NH20-0111 TaxID=3127648 RepID=UPI00333FCC95